MLTCISFAGSDTTAITLRAIFYFLVKYPRVYAKLQAEIDAFDSAGKFGETVPFDIGNEMPYLFVLAVPSCATTHELTWTIVRHR